MAELCAKLEQDNSLQHTNHEPIRNTTEAKARDMEAHSGMESFSSYARKQVAPLLAEAQSWEQLHSTLAEAGISLRLRGNGLVMVDHAGTVAVKASVVARDLSKAKLEKRFGVFVPHDARRTTDRHSVRQAEKPLSTYQKTPLSGSGELYRQYQREQETARMERKAQLAAVWDEQTQLIRRIAVTAKLNLPRAASYHLKRTLRLQARNSANAAIMKVRQTTAKNREEIKARHKTLGYVEWLKREAELGNIQAIYALRKRGAVSPAIINITARDLRDAKLIAAKISHVTGRGTLFYKSGNDVIRDNGSHLSLKKEISDHGVKSALLIAMAKFNGQHLMINGTDEFKAKCIATAVAENLHLTFADRAMEQERISSIFEKSNTKLVPLRAEEQNHPRQYLKTRDCGETLQGMGR